MHSKKYMFGVTGLLGIGLMLLMNSLWQPVQAQELRIGYTDHELILAQMPEYREILQQLQKLAAEKQAQYEAKVKEFQQKVEDYQKKQALMSPEVRQKREQELVQLQQEIQQFLAQQEQELGQKEMELTAPLLEKLDEAIKAVAKERKLDLVLRARAGAEPLILFASERIVDITADVMQKLGIVPEATSK